MQLRGNPGSWLPVLLWVVGGPCLAQTTRGQQPPVNDPVAATRTESDAFYRLDKVQVIHLEIAPSDLEKMRQALPKRIYVPATFRWNDQSIARIGVRYKGNSSSHPRQQHKRSFLLKFSEYEEGLTFLGMQRVALDNGVQFGSLFSEPLTTGVLRELGLPASRCNFAKLYLNGTDHGVYVNVERIDTEFVTRHFGDGSGALYKVDEGGAGATLGPVPRSVSRQDLAFEPKSAAADADARDVLELIRTINETSPENFGDVMEETIHLENFLKTMAVMLFAGAFDQLTGWNPHNYYLYHDPRDDRWHYLPWDLDVGYADNAFGRIPVISGWNAAWPVPGGPPRPLLERIVDDPQLLARYRRLADEILEQHFHPQVLAPRLDALYALIKDDLVDDPFPHRRVTNPEDRGYESIVGSLQAFIRLRYETARAQLDAPGARPPRSPSPRGRQPAPGAASPDAPSELRVVAQNASSVTLRWQDNAQREAGHILQRASGEEGAEFRNLIGQPGPDITSATDASVVAGQTYRYRVYAVHPTPTGPRGTGVSNIVTVRVSRP